MTKEIEERAKKLLDTILERYYSRETWDNRSLAEMIDEEMLKYTKEMQDIIEPAIYTALAESFTKTIPTVVPTPVQLSNMLYKNAKKVSAETYAVIKQSIKGQETATALAMKLYDGYNFKDEAVLDVYERLPKYIKNYIAKPTNKKEIIRNINKLKTKPLKVATQQIVKAVEDMNEKALEKALKVVTEEKSRYYANRIAQTETQRAKSLADAKDMMDDDEIEFIKHEMSSLHKIYDICDAFNDSDAYGYGKGIYPKEKFPALTHHPHCLPGDALISSRYNISNVFRRWYEGTMYRITTKTGRVITCTPNHPILTSSGFISPCDLDLFDKIACESGDNDNITRIDELFNSFLVSSGMSPISVPVSTEHFHGDGIINTKVDIININSFLGDNTLKNTTDIIKNKLLVSGCYFCTLFDSIRNLKFLFSGDLPTSNSVMGSLNIFGFPLLTPTIHSDLMLLGHSPDSNTMLNKPVFNKTPGCVIFRSKLSHGDSRRIVGSNSLDRNIFFPTTCNTDTIALENIRNDEISYSQLSSYILDGSFGDSIFMDDIVNIEDFFWSGHVYNLENKLGYYTCNGIITHNCKCKGVPYYRSPKKKKSGYGMRKFIEDQPAYKQRDILGSWDNVKKFKNGTSPVTIWNSQRGEKYRIQTVSEVLSNTRPFKQ